MSAFDDGKLQIISAMIVIVATERYDFPMQYKRKKKKKKKNVFFVC